MTERGGVIELSGVSIERRTDGSITLRVTVGKEWRSTMRTRAQREFEQLDRWRKKYLDAERMTALKGKGRLTP